MLTPQQDRLGRLTNFFAPIEAVLNDFAGRFGLYASKYRHERDEWTFQFRHPLGGICGIQVLKVDSSRGPAVHVAAGWGLNDYANYSRKTLLIDGGAIAVDDPELGPALESLLHRLLALHADDLVSDGFDFRRIWRAEQIAQATGVERSLPFAKI